MSSTARVVTLASALVMLACVSLLYVAFELRGIQTVLSVHRQAMATQGALLERHRAVEDGIEDAASRAVDLSRRLADLSTAHREEQIAHRLELERLRRDADDAETGEASSRLVEQAADLQADADALQAMALEARGGANSVQRVNGANRALAREIDGHIERTSNALDASLARTGRAWVVAFGLLALTLVAGGALVLICARESGRGLRRLAAAMAAACAGRGVALDASGPRHEPETAAADGFNAMLGLLDARTAAMEQAEQIVRSMNEAVLVVDAAGALCRANRAAEALLGRRESELRGMTLKDLLVDPWVAHRALAEPASTRPGRLDAELHQAGVGGVPVTLSVAGLSAADQPDERFVVVLLDAVEHRRAARQMADSEARLRDFAESASDWFWETGPDLRFTFFSSRFTEVTGLDPYSVLGRTREELPLDVPRAVWEHHLETLHAHRPFRGFVFPRTTPDGRRVWLSISGVPVFDGNGVFEGYRGTGADVTDRERAKLALVAARDASEAAARAKGEFVANVSHEIRTPMNGVLGMLDLLADSSLTTEQSEWVEIATRSGRSLLSLLNDILDFSKLESDRLELESTAFDVAALVEEVTDMLAEQAQTKGLDLVYRVAPGVPPAIVGDPGRVRQVLTNLVGNAVKFTREGSVAVTVEVEEPSTEGEGARLRVVVRDTGIGIAPSAHQRIFDSFTQADGSTTRHFGGTGLGLAISRRLTRRMGGDITVRSALGEGSAFTLEVACSVAETPPAKPGLGGETVLVVCGVDAERAALASQVEHAGGVAVAVNRADRVGAALSTVEAEGRVRTVLVDARALGADPAADLARLRAAVGPSARVVVITSRLSVDRRRLGAPAGVDAYAARPLGPVHLARCLRLAAADSARAAGGDGAVARVLLVEDNAVNRKVASGLLQRLGHEVETAVDGQAALVALANQTFDLVLMDCQMPVLDGYATATRIRQSDAPWAAVPIVALTANALAGDAERCLAAGMDDHIAKPVSRDKLHAAVQRWVGRDRAQAHSTAESVGAVDARAFAELRGALGSGVSAVVGLFREDGPARVVAMGAAARRGDAAAVTEIVDAARTLASTSASLGAARLSRLCAAVGAAAREGDLAEVERILGGISRELTLVLEALERLDASDGLAA
ncbi:MAG: response regulator [Ectothiorhodospiraceae bacterium]|nr:response regulator [Ectothiorhodospiraceae bacterium]